MAGIGVANRAIWAALVLVPAILLGLTHFSLGSIPQRETSLDALFFTDHLYFLILLLAWCAVGFFAGGKERRRWFAMGCALVLGALLTILGGFLTYLLIGKHFWATMPFVVASAMIGIPPAVMQLWIRPVIGLSQHFVAWMHLALPVALVALRVIAFGSVHDVVWNSPLQLWPWIVVALPYAWIISRAITRSASPVTAAVFAFVFALGALPMTLYQAGRNEGIETLTWPMIAFREFIPGSVRQARRDQLANALETGEPVRIGAHSYRIRAKQVYSKPVMTARARDPQPLPDRLQYARFQLEAGDVMASPPLEVKLFHIGLMETFGLTSCYRNDGHEIYKWVNEISFCVDDLRVTASVNPHDSMPLPEIMLVVTQWVECVRDDARNGCAR